MDKEQATIKIKDILTKMGCTDIIFSSSGEDTIIAIFNCKEVTSFVEIVADWAYSGIQLDQTKERQYKIIFNKAK